MFDQNLYQRTRILIVEMPAMLRDIIREIVADADDMEVVGELDDRSGIATFAENASADFVIAGLIDSELDQAYRQLFVQRPATRILAVAHEGRQGALYELSPQSRAIGELSPETLLAVIRGDSEAAPAPGGSS